MNTTNKISPLWQRLQSEYPSAAKLILHKYKQDQELAVAARIPIADLPETYLIGLAFSAMEGAAAMDFLRGFVLGAAALYEKSVCRKCGGVGKPSMAYGDAFGEADEVGKRTRYEGKGALIAVTKCSGCGHSWV